MIDSIRQAEDAVIRRQQEIGKLPKLLLTAQEAETLCGLCSKTIAKHVPPVRIGRAVRWRYTDLVARWAGGGPAMDSGAAEENNELGL